MLDYRHATIDAWPTGKLRPHWERRETVFKDKQGRPMPLSDTLSLLERELGQIRGENVIIQTSHPASALTLAYRIRSGARRPDHPGVILCFDSRFGPLRYLCDTFKDWESNLRAIGFHLENVRHSTLYGVGKDGEAYRGFAALPPVESAPQKTARQEAIDTLCRIAYGEGVQWQQEACERDPETLQRAIAEALKRAHPDHGGSRELLEAAKAARLVVIPTRNTA